MLKSGLILDRDPHNPDRWVLGLNARDVLEHANWRHSLGTSWLQAWIAGAADPTGSPYSTMIRILPGQSVVLVPGAPPE